MKNIFIITLITALFVGCSFKAPEKKQKNETSFSPEGKTITVYSTDKQSGDRLTLKQDLSFGSTSQPTEAEVSVFVNPAKQFQTFIGIGGAITDASAEVFAKLSKEKQQELINAYYGEDGIDHTLLRTTIHSCDFSSGSYTYIEEGDKELTSFSIDHDRQYRIPMIQRAMDAATEPLLFYVSPWSPPAFMKGRDNMLRGGSLLPEFYQSWASYYAKFIKAYEAEGFPIWGLTIQNEPMAVQTWESCVYTAEQERDFLKNYLGPTLEKEGLGDKKIVVWDHNRDLITHRANTIFGDPEAAKYAWGIGFHWYERWAGGESMWDNLKNVKESFPEKELLFTEGCIEAFDETQYQRWSNGERYGISMINDFNCGTVGWTDWNILLDQTGGPNHVGNFCFAPIHADTRTDELIYTPSYYYMGHFSKFIRPGAKRVSTTTSRSHLLSTSFLNNSGKMVTVVMNRSDEDITYNLIVDEFETEINIPAHGIQSLVY
ncbi:glucosylceramidase [Saccharicrinis carchari]|uniref:Glucosylceramidase n=1 Tax=Saccharicrinis carchari TaxID=1168039 RepID=A0A521D4L3_SACCC|nr:glycoside hydrolase family 30 protein [Saccharicrinis carchari]SMO66605.1 glucosylceramidase [Saccharicrinis carchari]